MLKDDVKLKVGCLLRRAGLVGAPKGVVACAGVILALLSGFVVWQCWPAGAQDSYAFQAPQSAEEAQAGSRGDGGEADASGGDRGPGGTESAGGAELEHIMVDVEGAVASPGLYELDQGARVGDAVEKAGGLSADAAPGGVNLAQQLEDGQQVTVPTKAQQAAAEREAREGSGVSAASAAQGTTQSQQAQSSGGKVNLNTAGADQLQTLPGVGPVLAQAIVDYREQNGAFSFVDDLKKVSGIGDVRFERLKDAVCV